MLPSEDALGEYSVPSHSMLLLLPWWRASDLQMQVY